MRSKNSAYNTQLFVLRSARGHLYGFSIGTLERVTRPEFFTASEVGNIVTREVDDPEYIFPGSDDDFDASLDIYDPLDREQGIIHNN